MALQDVDPLMLCVIMSVDIIKTTKAVLSCNVLNDFVKSKDLNPKV